MGPLFTTHPQTTPHECHGMTSLTTPHLSSALVASAECPDTHLPCKSSQIPLSLKSCRQGHRDTSSRGGHEQGALWEGKHTPPHYSPGCGMQELLAAKCCHAQRLSHPSGTSIKAGPEPLSLTASPDAFSSKVNKVSLNPLPLLLLQRLASLFQHALSPASAALTPPHRHAPYSPTPALPTPSPSCITTPRTPTPLRFLNTLSSRAPPHHRHGLLRPLPPLRTHPAG